MKKILIAAGLMLIAAFGANYAFFMPASEQLSTKNKEALAIGYSRLRISLPVFVAKERGFFDKHGIDADLKMYETAQPLMQALLQGQIDVAGYTALPITYNGMLRSKKDLLFTGLMIEDQDNRVSYLLRPKGSAEISNISDLQGKSIGILPTIAYKAWLEAMLKAENVPLETVRIQQIAPTLQAKSLASGGVDALFTNDPAATSAIRNNIAELVSQLVEVPRYLGEPFVFGSFNVSKAWADNNPELYRKVVAALDEAIAFINEKPDEAKEAMAPYLPDVFKADVKAYPSARYFASTDTTLTLLQAAADQYLDIGIIKDRLDLSSAIRN